jgi:hypothetical protein
MYRCIYTSLSSALNPHDEGNIDEENGWPADFRTRNATGTTKWQQHKTMGPMLHGTAAREREAARERDAATARERGLIPSQTTLEPPRKRNAQHDDPDS